MLFNNQKMKKIAFLAVMVLVLAGCTANLENGKLIESRIIDNNTAWTLSQGWFDFLFVMPVAKLILLFEKYIGIVAAIIIVTIITNLLTLPFMIKSTVMTQKMTLIQPQLERIQNKYRGRNDQSSQARMSAEISALYQKNGIKMGQAMLLPFLSMPIMLAMWQAVQRIPTVYDAILCGINLGELPMQHITSGHWQYLVLVVLMGVFQFGSIEITNILQKRSKNYKKPAQQKGQTSMKLMNMYMLVLIVVMSLSMPAAMSIYWICTSLFGIFRSIYIHYKFTEKM